MWFSNPLASPLLLPTLEVVGSIMGIALVLLVIKERRNLGEIPKNELVKRWYTWVFIALLYTFAVLSGRIPVLLFVSFMVFQGLREYASLVGLPGLYRWVLLGMGLLAWLLGHFTLIYLYVHQGEGLLLALGLAIALSDVGAYTLGKTFGKHKLAPKLSPNKTWEGVAGNLVGAAIGIGLMSFALLGALPLPLVFALPVVIAIGAVWGDLLESAIKREVNVKDAGTWLPGFGGLLDRIDSLIVVVPIAYYLVKFAGGL